MNRASLLGRASVVTSGSLGARLSRVLVATALVVAGIAGVWSYQSASARARDLQDDVLVQVAGLAASAGPGRLSTDTAPLSSTAADIDVGPLDGSGLTATTPDGLRTITVGGTTLRAAVARGPDGTAVVATQTVAVRDRLARDAALSSVLPLLVLIPLLTGAIVLVVRAVLAPVGELAEEVSHRDASDLSPVDETRAPGELRGFITALNEQAGRAAGAVAHERRFIAQAAHELRTPLTAMTVQLERARAARTSTDVDARLADLHTGMARSRHLVDQLLDLARAQVDDGAGHRAEAFDGLLRAVVAEVLPQADAAAVEIAVESGADERALVPVAATASALRNVLDNAVRYGASGGVVAIATRRDGEDLVVTVDDAGPGMGDVEALLARSCAGRTPASRAPGSAWPSSPNSCAVSGGRCTSGRPSDSPPARAPSSVSR
ncbi:hypothetical protein G7075_14945 [Phycicoccus sp. HDW14]|uniref:histidine kinase dimerization/phospho-acceptor domain-containing protein n=1 Tax=Phycicoccus sp. HDW14 TaxID=2714941 RepID=UPI00140A97DF|nr:histidine kinase dimerization/phospho-acceptor domain-containing protein [Phycicoccus sp. HDW14]QIM22133.1 hypothetical protein G7075_14945 [Phycicoccus sp. HDW14]